MTIATAAKRPETPLLTTRVTDVMRYICTGSAVFDWDKNNLKKIRAHGFWRLEVEQALSNDPIPIYEQDAGDEQRYVY